MPRQVPESQNLISCWPDTHTCTADTPLFCFCFLFLCSCSDLPSSRPACLHHGASWACQGCGFRCRQVAVQGSPTA